MTSEVEIIGDVIEIEVWRDGKTLTLYRNPYPSGSVVFPRKNGSLKVSEWYATFLFLLIVDASTHSYSFFKDRILAHSSEVVLSSM